MNKLILGFIFLILAVIVNAQTAPIKKKSYVDEQKILNVEASTPRAGYISAPYRKTDGNWYEKTDAGVEQLIIDTVAMLATKYDLENVSVDTVAEIATKYDIIKQLKYFANIAAIPVTLELGERIKIEDNGAEYFVQNTTVAGYNSGAADGVAVIDLGGSKYAVLQTDVLTIEMLGGNGNGIIDNQSALQKYFDFPNASNLTLQSSANYYVASTVTITAKNKKITGNGATISFPSSVGASNGFLIEPNSNNFHFDNIKFFAPADQTYYSGLSPSSNVRFILTGSSDYENIKNIKITDCTFSNAANGIKINYVEGVTIERDTFIECVTSMLANEPLGMSVNGVYSVRNTNIETDGQTHHFYSNGGDKLRIENSHFIGGNGKACNIKTEAGFRKRELVYLNNIIVDSVDGFWLQNIEQINITNSKSINSQDFISVNGIVDDVFISNCSHHNIDSLNVSYFYRTNSGYPNVFMDNVSTLSPISIKPKSSKTVNITNSIFVNHTTKTGGIAQSLFDMDTNDSTILKVSNSTFIQNYTPSDTKIFRIENDNNRGKTFISDCQFLNNTGVDLSYFAINLSDAGFMNLFIDDVKTKGYTRAVNINSTNNSHIVTNVLKSETGTIDLDNYLDVGVDTDFNNEDFIFISSGDSLTIYSTQIANSLKGKSISVFVASIGGIIATEGNEEINGSTNDLVFNRIGLFQLTSDGVNVKTSTSVENPSWTENANGIHYSAGNVGIGVSLPTSDFHVDGKILNTFSGAADKFEITTSDSNDPNFMYLSAPNAEGGTAALSITVEDDLTTPDKSILRFQSSGNGSWMPFGLNPNGGNIIIGSAADLPTASLQIVSATGLQIEKTFASQEIRLNPNTNANSWINVAGKNFGIGTATPSEKLDVEGTIQATDINFTGLLIFADEAAAVTGGLATGDCYKTATGELRIKL